MNFEEMIQELTKQRQDNIQKLNELNVLIIKQEAQIQLLSYLIEQAEGHDGDNSSQG